MNILAVDDEQLALSELIQTIRQAAPDARITGCRSAQAALEAAEEQPPDIAFLDIEMRGMSGMKLAERLMEAFPKCNLIFTTGYSSYTQQAFGVHASGYILKPVTPEKVRAELRCLRYPAAEVRAEAEPRLTVRAFSDFEVYQDGTPLHFTYSKTKEVLAFLIDRNGALCTTQQVAAILWEDAAQSHASYLNNIRSDLLNTMAKYGCADVLVVRRGAMGVVPGKIRCDYFDYLNADDSPEGQRARQAYRGEYMSQYTWAEVTNSHLSFQKPD